MLKIISPSSKINKTKQSGKEENSDNNQMNIELNCSEMQFHPMHNIVDESFKDNILGVHQVLHLVFFL